MSAIDVHIGTQDPEDRDAPMVCRTDIQGLDAARACAPELSATHAGLTRSVWIRRSIEDLLQGRQYRIVDGSAARGPVRKLFFSIEPGIQQYEIPWMPSAQELFTHTGLFGMSSKMGCPTWDLPAGAPAIGGSCPGALAGQSVIPINLRKKQVPTAEPQGADIANTICQLCYASGGNYLSPHVQIGEVVRYWWCRDSMLTPQGRSQWVDIMVRAIAGETWASERPLDPRTGKPILPIRIHSSGDFFSRAYAEAWIEVCNRVPEVMFWAPTRTWAAGWNNTWREILPNVEHGNLVLRPSAYHTYDAAPHPAGPDPMKPGETRPANHPWSGDYPYTSAGTTALYKPGANASLPMVAPDKKGVMQDPRADWLCQTYAIMDDSHSCRNALAPDGKIGCRACWIRPDLTVNYTVH